jgi:hypothetical protein
LLARLTWDWESYEKLQHGGRFKDIEFQACRMDICHLNKNDLIEAWLVACLTKTIKEHINISTPIIDMEN